MPVLAENLIAVFEELFENIQKPVALHEPYFKGQEWKYTKECIDTGWVSSAGAYVDRFEKDLAKVCGTKYAISTVNGTAALHIALKIARISEGDEVAMPSMTFVASANAVSYCGATGHFIDIEEKSLGLCPNKLEETLKSASHNIKAIMPVHIFGHPANMDDIQNVADRFNIPVIADAAEALGSLYGNKPVTSKAKVSTISFNGNKIITTGGGGAILTDDEDLAEQAKHLTTTAKNTHPWSYIHDEIGYNYRMPNINAALGCAQLEQLAEFLKSKRKLAEFYEHAFDAVENVEFVKEPEYAKSNYWLNALKTSPDINLQNILKKLNQAGFLCRPIWEPMHKLSMYRNSPHGDLSITESLSKRILNIPSSPSLGEML